MTRESFDCLEKLVPEGLSERMEAPPVFLHGSGTAPHQVVLNCTPEVAERAARARSAELRAGG